MGGQSHCSCFYYQFFIHILRYHQKRLMENCVKKKKLLTYGYFLTSKTLHDSSAVSTPTEACCLLKKDENLQRIKAPIMQRTCCYRCRFVWNEHCRTPVERDWSPCLTKRRNRGVTPSLPVKSSRKKSQALISLCHLFVPSSSAVGSKRVAVDKLAQFRFFLCRFSVKLVAMCSADDLSEPARRQIGRCRDGRSGRTTDKVRLGVKCAWCP